MLIESISLDSILSFKQAHLDLRPLNVLIGVNGAGKSNLIQAIGLTGLTHHKSLPSRYSRTTVDWIWKGPDAPGAGEIQVTLPQAKDGGEHRKYALRISEEHPEGRVTITESDPTGAAAALGEMWVQDHWDTRAGSPARRPTPSGSQQTFPHPDISNLAQALHHLAEGPAGDKVQQEMGWLCRERTELRTSLDQEGYTFRLVEGGDETTIPQTRVSEGILRYLGLMAILCHPEPPPLVCLKQPERDIHPDLHARLAVLLMEASQRTQIVVETHATEILDRLWEDPESIIVCERMPLEGTTLTRIRKEDVQELLERYELGEMWRSGHLGGNLF